MGIIGWIPDFLLKEDGDQLLQEDGDDLLVAELPATPRTNMFIVVARIRSYFW